MRRTIDVRDARRSATTTGTAPTRSPARSTRMSNSVS